MSATIDAELVRIPAGEIDLRDDRKKTRWTASIEPFLLGRHQVTQALYASVMSLNPSTFTGDRKPVEGVSWYDAIAFCNALSEAHGLACVYILDRASESVQIIAGADGYRLPTDAEWEYACRANLRAVQYGEVDDIAWYEGNAGESTHDVGLKAANPFGLFDMLGNVWEWCWDVYDPEVYGTYRIFRGGGWCDPSRGCLASNRRRSHPTYMMDDVGFRVARTPAATEA